MATSLKERFWLKVDFSLLGCWNFKGVPTKAGYGQVNVDRSPRKVYAHRFAWQQFNGEIPKGLMIMHTCDNPLCVRHDHLQLGTHRDNMRDMVNKRRASSGESNPSSKLTRDQAKTIRVRNAFGETQVSLAKEYRVSHTTIGYIVRGKNWKV